MYAEILSLLGVPAEESYQIAEDHRQAELSEIEHALLDFTLKLSARREAFSGEDVESLRRMGVSEQQILEAVAVTAFTLFLNTVQQGTGASPDFAPRRSFHLHAAKNVNLSSRIPVPPRRQRLPTPTPSWCRKRKPAIWKHLKFW